MGTGKLLEVCTLLFDTIKNEFNAEKLVRFFHLFFAVAVIALFFKVLIRFVGKITAQKCSAHVQKTVSKALRYSSYVLIILTVFHRLGINISAILGAAGIAGIAIGFAAQTSVSNIISGLFVLTERAFKIDDVIEINGTIGTVQSVNLLSVVLRTFDNQYVRIPNETIIKASLVNYSYFPVRRLKTELSVAYGTDLRHAESVLLSAAAAHPLVLQEPAPSVLWTKFDDSGITVTLNTWTNRENFGTLRNTLFIEVYERFLKEHIEIPFQQIDIHLKEYPPEPQADRSC